MERTLILDCLNKINGKVCLKGWVNTLRDHGKVVFLDLRDRSGIIQVVGGKELKKLRQEDVVEISGNVNKRPVKLINPRLPTGTLELQAEKINLLSQAQDLPFPIDTDGYEINEEIRSKYRYLDLRRQRLTGNLRLRSQVTQFIRNFLVERNFIEVETPILTKTTPEGARDFIVPSRLQPGNFYALPQSPQQYKQLLMIAGLEKYFQIARCFRDEDPRKDRAYGEFTQLDLEMSFVTQEDILKLTEELFTSLVKQIFPQKRITQTPWPRLAHQEARKKYNSDKPDLRNNSGDPDELAFAWVIDFPLFSEQTEADFYHGSGAAKFAPSHHMFTAPHPDDLGYLYTDPLKVRGLQHDLILNGYEVGGGSIRIHDSKIQDKVFDLIGFTGEQKQQFEHMLTAFTYGVPPHGGIAPGLDRFLMAVLGEPSIREVMAFPASASGQTSVMDAPSPVGPQQLKELRLKLAGSVDSGLSAYENLIVLIKDRGVGYEEISHPPVHTSQEAAKIRGTNLRQGAKALVVFADKEPILLVLSAATKVNNNAFKKAYHVKDLRLASPEEVVKLTGLEIGAIPPFGILFNLPTYCDSQLSLNREISFNAGRHDRSVKISYPDYEKIAKPIIGDFSKNN